jgi:hypothetical protein
MRTLGWVVRNQVSAAGTRASVAVWKAAIRRVPARSGSEAAISTPAVSSWRRIASVWATRISA